MNKFKIGFVVVSLCAMGTSYSRSFKASQLDELCRYQQSLACVSYMVGLFDGAAIGLHSNYGPNNVMSGQTIIKLFKKRLRNHPEYSDYAAWQILQGIMFQYWVVEYRASTISNKGKLLESNSGSLNGQ